MKENLRKNVPWMAMLLSLMIILSSLGSCQNEARWTGSTRQENGVVKVENPAEPLYENASISLTEELSISGKNADSGSELISVYYLDVDGAGNIYALDGKAYQIKAFDALGRFIGKIGTVGQGPGEFQSPLMIKITDENELAVMDSMGKILFYSRDGHFINENINAALSGVMPRCMDGEARVYGTQTVYEPASGVNLVRIIPDSKSIGIVSSVENPNHFEKREIAITRPYFTCAADGKNRLIWGYPDEYVLNIEDSSGSRIMRMGRKTKAVSLTEKDKEAEKKAYASMLKMFPDFHLVIGDIFPFFHQIYVDDDGRIIVGTHERTRAGLLTHDVFDSEGRYVAKIVIPSNIGHLRWKNGKLYGVSYDEEGYPIIKRYAVKWNFGS